ncbi:MAG TPA: glycine cleavage system protein GcvH [Dehalococcoidia bacterium]|nr:glycine cleavage system protein GcvH [Dehalococcoidia bacterium]
MPTPDDRRYTKEHEWVRLDGETARIGITEYAQDQLGDIVYVDLPEAGEHLDQFGKLGEIESVKAVSDLFAPVSGDVLSTNHAIVEHPELVNSSPYDEGWLLELRVADPAELDKLLSAREYDAFTEGEAKDEAMRP